MSGRFRMKQCTFGQTIHTVSNGFLFFDVFGSPDEAQRVCDRLNELHEENQSLKKKLEFFNELNKPYGTIIEENKRLKSFIKSLASSDGKIWLSSGYGYRIDKILNDFNNTENDDGDVE